MNAEVFIMKCRQKGISLLLENNDLRIKGNREPVNAILPAIRQNKADVIRHLQYEALIKQLEPFQFGDTDTPEADRINNIAWELMKADGMPYAKAIRTASQIAAKCHIAKCEAAYENVRALWQRITGKVTSAVE